MKHRISTVFKKTSHDKNKRLKYIIDNDNKLILDSIYYGSLFYAAEMFELKIMSYFTKMTRRFIFCGSMMTEEILLKQMDTAPDYKVIGYRKVELDEIISTEWFPTFLEGYNDKFFTKHYKNPDIKQPFAYYIIYEQRKQLPQHYVDNRLRILYVCGESVSTYKALFNSNKNFPFYVARVYNKFSSKYEKLIDEDEQLHRAITNNPYGRPETVLIGGGDNVRNNNDIPIWEEYKPYTDFALRYGIHLEDNLAVWRRKVPWNYPPK